MDAKEHIDNRLSTKEADVYFEIKILNFKHVTKIIKKDKYLKAMWMAYINPHRNVDLFSQFLKGGFHLLRSPNRKLETNV